MSASVLLLWFEGLTCILLHTQACLSHFCDFHMVLKHFISTHIIKCYFRICTSNSKIQSSNLSWQECDNTDLL